jgi:hypothetical protein
MRDAVLVCLLVATVTALLVGCVVAGATPMNGPDGQPGWFSIWCKTEQKNCVRKSAEVCPHGYELVDMSENAGTTFVAYRSGYVYPIYRGYIVIQCHGDAGAVAVADGGYDGE